MLTLEHRSAPAPDPIVLHFRTEPTPHLAVLPGRDPAPMATADQLEAALLACLPKMGVARPTDDLREQVNRRKTHVLEALRRLEQQGLVEHTKAGWRRAGAASGTDTGSQFPVPPLRNGNSGTTKLSAESAAKTPSGLPPETPPPPGVRS